MNKQTFNFDRIYNYINILPIDFSLTFTVLEIQKIGLSCCNGWSGKVSNHPETIENKRYFNGQKYNRLNKTKNRNLLKYRTL